MVKHALSAAGDISKRVAWEPPEDRAVETFLRWLSSGNPETEPNFSNVRFEREDDLLEMLPHCHTPEKSELRTSMI